MVSLPYESNKNKIIKKTQAQVFYPFSHEILKIKYKLKLEAQKSEKGKHCFVRRFKIKAQEYRPWLKRNFCVFPLHAEKKHATETHNTIPWLRVRLSKNTKITREKRQRKRRIPTQSPIQLQQLAHMGVWKNSNTTLAGLQY